MTPPENRPIFGSALARSGAGLLSHMASAHPAITLARNPFLEYFKSLRDAIVSDSDNDALTEYCPPGGPLLDYYFDPRGPALLDAVLGASLDPAVKEPWETLGPRMAARTALESSDLAPHVQRVRAPDHGLMMDRILGMIGEVRGASAGSCVGFQEPWIADMFPALARRYPAARFVLLQRDPRAVVVSLKRIARTQPDQVVQVLSYARHWRKYTALATAFSDPGTSVGRLLAGRLLIIRYEDLTDRPEGEMRRLCDFLDLPFDKDMTRPERFHDHNTGAAFQGNSSFGEVGARIDAAAGKRWETSAPDDLIAAVEWLCGPDMALAGYAPASAHPHVDDVIDFLAADSRTPTAWRSDTGDLPTDLGNELFRHSAIGMAGLDDDIVRRMFLFPVVHQALHEDHHVSRGG